MCACTSAAEYAGIDCGRKVYFICVSSSGLICVAVYVLTPLALVISRRAVSTTWSLAAWRSSWRAMRLEPPSPIRNTSRNTRLNLTRSFMAWLEAGGSMGGRGRRDASGRVKDGRPFGVRLQPLDEAAAELRLGGEAAPA